jgi:hypothetical protein
MSDIPDIAHRGVCDPRAAHNKPQIVDILGRSAPCAQVSQIDHPFLGDVQEGIAEQDTRGRSAHHFPECIQVHGVAHRVARQRSQVDRPTGGRKQVCGIVAASRMMITIECDLTHVIDRSGVVAPPKVRLQSDIRHSAGVCVPERL